MSEDRRAQDRRASDPRVAVLVEKIRVMETRQDDLAKQLEFNTKITEAVRQNTADIVEVWKAAHGGLKVLGWMGAIARWVTIIAGCVAAVGGAYYALTHWGIGPGPEIKP